MQEKPAYRNDPVQEPSTTYWELADRRKSTAHHSIDRSAGTLYPFFVSHPRNYHGSHSQSDCRTLSRPPDDSPQYKQANRKSPKQGRERSLTWTTRVLHQRHHIGDQRQRRHAHSNCGSNLAQKREYQDREADRNRITALQGNVMP